MSVCLKLRISVTADPIGLYSLGNVATGPDVVLRFFSYGEEVGTPIPITHSVCAPMVPWYPIHSDLRRAGRFASFLGFSH